MGTQRLANIAIGDKLDGAPEPKVSAPSTAEGKPLSARKKKPAPPQKSLLPE
jgi:hypothetical protein